MYSPVHWYSRAPQVGGGAPPVGASLRRGEDQAGGGPPGGERGKGGKGKRVMVLDH